MRSYKLIPNSWPVSHVDQAHRARSVAKIKGMESKERQSPKS